MISANPRYITEDDIKEALKLKVIEEGGLSNDDIVVLHYGY